MLYLLRLPTEAFGQRITSISFGLRSNNFWKIQVSLKFYRMVYTIVLCLLILTAYWLGALLMTQCSSTGKSTANLRRNYQSRPASTPSNLTTKTNARQK